MSELKLRPPRTIYEIASSLRRKPNPPFPANSPELALSMRLATMDCQLLSRTPPV